MTVTGPACLGSELSALVDGELDHGARDRAYAHLAHCDRCRAEVDALRRTKLRLAGAAGPGPDPAFLARLGALAVPGVSPGHPRVAPAAPAAGWSRPTGRRPATPRPAGRPARGPAAGRAGRPADRPSVRRPSRRVAAGGLALLGLGVALALGGQRAATGTTTPVDPATASFVSDYYSTTSEIPLSDSVSSASIVVPVSRAQPR